MSDLRRPRRIETVVVGGGQAGLSVGYHLARRGLEFVILDAHERIGDAWRHRWDSLRLFTPARYSGLAGMPFPGGRHTFPTKDEMADYLESYAARFDLPVRTGVRVERVWSNGNGYLVVAGDHVWEADNVVVAMSTHQQPRRPPFADRLDPAIVQLHSADYRNPSQLRDGPVLVVGAANSGAEIALEAADGHRTWLSGRHPGHVPFRIEGAAGRVLVPLVLRGLFHRVLTVRTPMGRRARPKVLANGWPLVRTKPKDLTAAGVERVPRVEGVREGLPLLADGRTLEVANVVWCTGFRAGLDWIDLPVFGKMEPRHYRGVVASHPGLYFVGLLFLYAASSEQIHGLDRDAAHVAGTIAARRKERSRAAG
ncbi:flavin-containing monooxygenase [Allosalinactinospora lopnorensis]|uniref:flavin-containing monooxygenase n=1 Tax=Allosalinactinospora lopnorensis TaxID=1352348 RepID=UPI000623C336|nr:FAD-dependent oxidoreductase [Allosalinactinospora lopnorensis]